MISKEGDYQLQGACGPAAAGLSERGTVRQTFRKRAVRVRRGGRQYGSSDCKGQTTWLGLRFAEPLALLGHCYAKGDNSIQRTGDAWHAPIGFFGLPCSRCSFLKHRDKV
jgi:hypothetical protein